MLSIRGVDLYRSVVSLLLKRNVVIFQHYAILKPVITHADFALDILQCKCL